MVAEKYMYNNGSRRNQLEIAESMSHDVITGFGHYYTKVLRKKFIIFVLMYTIKNKQVFIFCIFCYRSIKKARFHFTNGLFFLFQPIKILLLTTNHMSCKQPTTLNLLPGTHAT